MFGLLDYFFFGVFAGLACLDLLVPARQFPAVRGWRLKGLLATAMYWFLAGYSPFIWDAWLGQYQLIDGTAWPVWVAAPAALLLYQLGIYAWHRTMHNSNLLWRVFHQTHHSAERVDIWGALYFHPLDVVGFAFVGSLALTLILGVSPEAIMFAVLVSTFCGLLQHANLKTPHWLGYIITRPESHALHHERGVHRYNYGDIPIWDMVFGTFRNPKQWNGQAGLVDGGSSKYLDLLLARDITRRTTRRGQAGPDLLQTANLFVLGLISLGVIAYSESLVFAIA
ncbi:sterol desaturase family protein [Henriciella aquimarina]|uniref:sterol desaturase family protein n=1 Tax=Henriciella aquimarina TaxID=545261 RepID=UPI000A06C278|nr:sterol desaturase family protein [Henriciella aquimarina]